MPTLHDLIPAALARLAHSAPEPTAERKATARAARASAGRRRLDGKLLTGSLACALAAAAAYPTTSTYDPWHEDIVATPGEFRFAPGTDTRLGFGNYDLDSYCGTQLPKPAVSSDGFTLDAIADTTHHDTPEWTSHISYEGLDRQAFADQGVGLIAKDGVVIGVQYNFDGYSSEPRSWTDGATFTGGGSIGEFSAARWCSLDWSSPRASAVAVDAGTYEAAWVVPVHMTARDAAEAALTEAGVSIASDAPLYPANYPEEYRFTFTWQPGSVDCLEVLDQAYYGAELPFQCVDQPPDLLTVEPDTGAVVVGFDPESLGPQVQTLLVSEPVTFTVDHVVTFGDLGWSDDDSSQTPEAPGCGNPSESLQWSTNFPQSLAGGAPMPELLSGDRVAMRLDYRSTTGDTEAAVSLPDGALVWIAPNVGTFANLDADGHVPFLAYATAHFTPATPQLHRDTGYPDVEMWLTDLTVCDGMSPDDASLRSHSTWLYLDSPVQIAWESGAVDTETHMVIMEDAHG